MNDVIRLILSLTASGTVIALILFVLKPLIRQRLPKMMQYYLWIVVLVRFILPLSLPVNGIGLISDPVANVSSVVFYLNNNPQNIRPSTEASVPDNAVSMTVSKLSAQTPVSAYDFNNNFSRFLFTIWLFGALASFFTQTACYMCFSKRIRNTNRPASENTIKILNQISKKKIPAFINHFVATPMLLGVLKPCIILPDTAFTDEQMSNIFLHELTHLRRNDIAIKWFTVFVTSIHWFNPIMHFLKKEINHACELSCDEAVIKSMNQAGKQSYGETLLTVAAEHKESFGALFTTMCEDKKAMKERLSAIMKFKNAKRNSVVTIFIIILVIFCTLASCAVPSKPANSLRVNKLNASSATANTIDFSSMSYQGLDTNPQHSITTYKMTDQTVMNKVWNDMNIEKWTETNSFESKANSVIILHFEGDNPGWYVIAPDNFGYFSTGTGKSLSQDSPLGFKKDSDKSYAIPKDVYNIVAKLLQDYTTQHPPQFQLNELLKDMLSSKDITILYKGLYIKSSSAAHIPDSYMNAFGYLNKWELVNSKDVGDFQDSETITMYDSDSSMAFFLKRDLVSISINGVQSWYRVPSEVMTEVLNTTQNEKTAN